MRIALYGHGRFSVQVLERILRPDRTISLAYDGDADPCFPIAGHEYGLPYVDPVYRDRNGGPVVDLIVSAGYQRPIPESHLARARLGAIGYHPSLLPLHRGRDAVKWAIAMGEKVTGGTVYQLTEELDRGPIYEQRHVFIRPGESARSLWDRALAPLGIEMLDRAIDSIEAGATPTAQDNVPGSWEPGFPRREGAA